MNYILPRTLSLDIGTVQYKPCNIPFPVWWQESIPAEILHTRLVFLLLNRPRIATLIFMHQKHRVTEHSYFTVRTWVMSKPTLLMYPWCLCCGIMCESIPGSPSTKILYNSSIINSNPSLSPYTSLAMRLHSQVRERDEIVWFLPSADTISS